MISVRVLVVEGDPKVARFLQRGLEAERHVVDVARTGAEAVRVAASRSYELVVLDLATPGLDGHELLRRLRGGGSTAGVIALNSRHDVEDRVRALDAGADDCLVKPVSFAELLARIRALRRRLSGEPCDGVLTVGELAIDLVSHRVTAGGRLLELTSREYQLLASLARRAGETLSRAVLLDRVWGLDFDPGSNVIDVYVSYLRRKLAAAGCASTIRTVRAAGYALEPAGAESTHPEAGRRERRSRA